MNRSIVIRQRPVYIQFDALSGGDENTISLNVFADVQLTAVRDHTEKDTVGTFAWTGSLYGAPLQLTRCSPSFQESHPEKGGHLFID